MEIQTFSKEEKEEIIRYGLERIKSTCIMTLVTLLMGCIFQVFFQSIIFLVCFIVLRKYAGGYHAKTETRCDILSDIILKIDSLHTLPIPALVSASNPENLCIDNEGKIHVIYSIDKINEKDSMADVYKNIASIIKLLLKNEFSNKYDKHLPLIIEKCEKKLWRFGGIKGY